MNHIQQYLRCYTEPIGEEVMEQEVGTRQQAAKRTAKPRRPAHTPTPEELAITAMGAPFDGWCFTLDCETTTDATQALRFGLYAINGTGRDERMRLYGTGQLTRAVLDTLYEEGIFYNPAALTTDELTALKAWAHEQDAQCKRLYGRRCWCLTLAEFVRNVFYRWVYEYGALCIGHNLAFDLSRLATRWATVDKGAYAGGFWLTLCDCGVDNCHFHPPMRVKHLGPAKNRYGFRIPHKIVPGSGAVDHKWKPYEGKFVDTMTLGRALLGPGRLDLRGLGQRAGVSADRLKVKWEDEHGGPLTPEYLDYCRRDVAATWALYQALREEYRRHGVSRPIWRIFSEASLGKAYHHDIGVPRFMQQHPDFPKGVIGHAMEAYYGGRSEVGHRLQPVDVIHCDFKSQYPTVNALMNLQELLLASKVDVRPCTHELGEWLHRLTLDDLQQPAMWRRLRVLVKVKPHGAILPVRSTFGDAIAATNIAVATVAAGLPRWYTLADVIASYLLTGQVPQILAALEIVPAGPPVDTQTWYLFGDARYPMNLSTHDWGTAIINARTRVQAEQEVLEVAGQKGTSQWERLDSQQRALKLLANATSYGILVEIEQAERTHDAKPIMCYDQKVHQVFTHVLEAPGTHFAGPIGTFIPAAGRLLLALCERLAAAWGIGRAFCDTDSMAFTRPEGLSREDFRRHVEEICAWFTPLSPYQDQPPLLQHEKVNYWDGEREPLFCLAISAKRYVLYNRLPDGTYRIRKFSSHGVGTWQKLKDYAPRHDIPCPCHYVVGCACLDCRGHDCAAVGCRFRNPDSTRHDCEDAAHELGGAHWMYDLWYHAIQQAERMALAPDLEDWQRRIVIGEAPWLDVPAKQQVTITTRHYYDLFKKHLPELRPFSFITMLPALLPSDIIWRVSDERDKGFHGHPETYDGLEGVAFYESPEGIRRMDTHDVGDIRHKTLRECLRDYFNHPEAKAANPRGIGVLERQHVVVVDQVYTGKETNQVLEELADESEGTLPYEDAQVFGHYGLAQAIIAHGVKNVAEATGMPPRTLYEATKGRKQSAADARRILDGLNACPPAHGCCADGTTPAELVEQRRRERRERGHGHVEGHGPEITAHGERAWG